MGYDPNCLPWPDAVVKTFKRPEVAAGRPHSHDETQRAWSHQNRPAFEAQMEVQAIARSLATEFRSECRYTYICSTCTEEGTILVFKNPLSGAIM